MPPAAALTRVWQHGRLRERVCQPYLAMRSARGRISVLSVTTTEASTGRVKVFRLPSEIALS
jgi:hypothetical protein